MEASEDIKKAYGVFSEFYRLNGAIGVKLLLFQAGNLLSFNLTEEVFSKSAVRKSFLDSFKDREWDKAILVIETNLEQNNKIMFQEFDQFGSRAYWCGVVGNVLGEMEPIVAHGNHIKDIMRLVAKPSRDVGFALTRVCEALNEKTWTGGMIFRFWGISEESSNYTEFPFSKGALASPKLMEKFVEFYSKEQSKEKIVLALGHSNGKENETETEIVLFEYTKDGFKSFFSEIDNEKNFGEITYADPKEFKILAGDKKIEFHSYFLKAVGC